MKTIPIRITKFPEKNYKNKVCIEPFGTINIDTLGDVRLCGCSNWMPTTIGNIFNNSIEELLNSDLAKDIRRSIRDGSYVYCNEKTCGIISNNQLIDSTNENLKDDSRWRAYLDESTPVIPMSYFIAADLTCNLSCPSCRKSVIKNSEFDTNNNHEIINNLNQQLFNGSSNSKVMITLSTSGEVFASGLLMNFLINFPLDRYPKAAFRIQTNGLLLKDRWSRINNIVNNIEQIVVTADSCVPDVYAKLRRGGNFKDLLENLNFISNLKKNLNFDFRTRMVVQKDNCNEIEKFYKWSKELGADAVEYTRITNWGTYRPTEFNDIDVLDSTHHLYSSTILALQKLRQDYNDALVFGFNC